MTIQQEVHKLLSEFKVPEDAFTTGSLTVTSPITGEVIAKVATTSAPDDTIAAAHKAFLAWRNVPATAAIHIPIRRICTRRVTEAWV